MPWGRVDLLPEPYEVTHTRNFQQNTEQRVGSAIRSWCSSWTASIRPRPSSAKNDFRGLQLVGKRQEVTIDQWLQHADLRRQNHQASGHRHGVKVPIVSRKNAKAQPDVFQVTSTLDFLRLGLGFSQGRQQHARQNGDDGDHDQQLDERESAYFRFFKR